MDREGLLLLQAKHGDAKAFESFVERFWKPVHALAYRFTGSRQEAEDLCQEVFLRVHLNLESFRGEGKAFTWLYRVAMNVCLNWKRKRREIPMLEVAEQKSQRSTSEDAVVRLEIQDALQGLSAQDRLLLILRKFYGFSYPEIAEMLSIPVEKVRSRLHDAKVRLAKRLEPFLEGGGEKWSVPKSNPS